MTVNAIPRTSSEECEASKGRGLEDRQLIIVSNRGPFSFQYDDDGELIPQRGGGGLVTALLGLSNKLNSTWIACALTDGDRDWKEGDLPFENLAGKISLRFVLPDPEAYDRYYSTIANPLLWFLQHSMWDFAYAPTFNRETWQAWDEGYVAVNRLFADAVVEQVRKSEKSSLVMLQDYHLYIAPHFIRAQLPEDADLTLTHFIHIPWPGPEDWGLIPSRMRQAILEGLCSVDLIGFQTREDALNFMRTCESLLPRSRVNYSRGQVMWNNHRTYVRDFPISIDVAEVHRQAASEETRQYKASLMEQFGDRQIILRIDRTEPSKNIVRGFQAFGEMLELYPEHHGKVQFVAILVPSRLEVEEYEGYMNELMGAAGQVNARFGTSDWEPIRVLVGESYPRALAAMQLYDVLLVNPIADGMNLVAKEGPTVNEKAGVLILSERAGAHQQLSDNAIVVSPCDVSETAEALHRALVMPARERKKHATRLREKINREDINLWMCWQVDEIQRLNL